jgi:hypothetical protein
MDGLNEYYLEQLYDTLSKEHMKLMNELKQNKDDSKDTDIQKQITMLNSLMINSLKLRNLKKKIMLKGTA